jgi:hypothetical protein
VKSLHHPVAGKAQIQTNSEADIAERLFRDLFANRLAGRNACPTLNMQISRKAWLFS